MKIITVAVLVIFLQGCKFTSTAKTTAADAFRLAEYRCEKNQGLYDIKHDDGYALCNNGVIVHLIETKNGVTK